jgi:hypothetical protein
MKFPSLLLTSVCLLPHHVAAQESDMTCSDGSVCRFADTSLPVKALMRPLRAIYAEPNEDAEVLLSNLRPFLPWYVFEMRDVDLSDPDAPEGWYQISTGVSDNPTGWARASDMVVWRSSVVVTYTNRGVGDDDAIRARTLLFGNLADLKALRDAPDAAEKAAAIIGAVEAPARSLDLAKKAGVVLIEPARFVDFKSGFYMLPVVDFEQFDFGLDGVGRNLRVAAVVPQTEKGAGDPTRLTGTEGGKDRFKNGGRVEDLQIDIKFVLDMTGSMQPYIDATREAVGRMINEIEKLGLPADTVRYGVVGYTDISGQCSDCNFVEAKDFTPDLAGANDVVKLLASSAARAKGGGDWDETVLAGVETAVQSRWRDNSLRFVVLIGDASAREGSRNGAATTAGTRSLASNAAGERTVFVLAIHARPNTISSTNNARAEAQFTELSVNPGSQTPAYYGIDVNPNKKSEVENKFITAIYELSASLVAVIEQARDGDIEAAIAGAGASTGDVSEIAKSVAGAALVEYLGEEAERPNDLTAWVSDVAFDDSSIRPLEARVLLEKKELNDLVTAMEEILSDYRKSILTSSDFFDQLQASVTSPTTGEGGGARDAKRLASAGDLLPSWIAALPYKSYLLSLTPESFTNMTPDGREKFEIDLEDKIYILKDFITDPDIWTKLHPESGSLSSVFPVPLSDLP